MAGAMTQIKKFVSHGYYFYVAGVVPASQISKLVWSFNGRFRLGASDGARDYARKKGRSTFRLVLAPIPNSLDIAFFLLCTDGWNPHLTTELWRDARKEPIRWPYLYELRMLMVPPELRVRYTRPGGKMAINLFTWTWRIRREDMDEYRFNIRRWVQQRDERLARLVHNLSLAPGERGVRNDVYQLHQYIEAQCHKHKVATPDLPARRWSTGKVGKTVPLSYLVGRASRGARTWLPD